jgi:DNA-directed RNA polymerase beta subunit
MSNSVEKNILNIAQKAFEDEVNPKIFDNTLLYGVGRSFLDLYPQHYDIMVTYEQALEEMKTIITSETTIEKQIRVNSEMTALIVIKCDNARLYSPDDPIARKYAPRISLTPNTALALRQTYSCLLVADFIISYTIGYNPEVMVNQQAYAAAAANFSSKNANVIVVPNGYIVQVPIPVGCKWCATQHYDQLTLSRSAEEMKEYYGFFIIEGFLKYIIPTYKKPINKPIIQKNNYDNQMARTDVIYAEKFDYEQSYYIVGAMVLEKSAGAGRKKLTDNYPDFGCSLQLAHPLMNDCNDYSGKRNKKLWNFVPIRYLFYAFGCTNDYEMLQYIHPELNNVIFMNTIKNACTFGHKHLEALEIANIDRSTTGFTRLLEPLDNNLAWWIIGNIILSEKTKSDKLKLVNNDKTRYKNLIIEITRQIIDERFMPGVGKNCDIDRDQAICIELGNIVRELYLIGYGLKPSQDRCSLINKRVRSGQQISREFKAFHKKRITDAFHEIEETILKLEFRKGRVVSIDQNLKQQAEQLATMCSVEQSKSLINSFKGVSKENSKLRTDIIVPKNIAFVQNKLREIVITQDTSKQGSEVSWDHRTVHPSELFFICPTQTPESGSQTGKYKTPTIYTYITLSTNPEEVTNVLSSHECVHDVRPIHDDSTEIYTIKLNGSCVGWVVQPIDEVYEDLMEARRDGRMSHDVSVILNHNNHEINIWTDIGRILSPFVDARRAFNVVPKASKDGFTLDAEVTMKPEFSAWLERINKNSDAYFEGIAKGFITIMCPDMCISNSTVADCLKNYYENPLIYTHIALPGHAHGIIANIVAGINTVTGVRASYLTNHVKQAIGPTARYPQCKYVALNNVLLEPEVPIVRSCTYDFMHIGDHAIGQNIIVAFMQYRDNQEDAFILNRTSVEQGMLAIDSIQTMDYKIEHSEEKFAVPDISANCVGNTDGYNKLDSLTCLPKEISTHFNQYDPLIGKCTINSSNYNANNNSKIMFIDSSIINETTDGSYEHTINPRCLRSVVKNSLLDNNKEYKKVAFGRYCVPIPGDKFNPEYCQKGTVGKILNNEDMPYTTNGLRPDLIFNPPSVFKRKTYGHVYYPILAKIAALMGCPLDCTSYHTLRSTEEIMALLQKMGLDDAGYETLYNPITGKKYKCRIFTGIHYWERQAHLVEMKINVRNGGPRDPITGQPVKGRKRNGGQSLDHMTFDAQNAAGVIGLMRDLHINQGSYINTGCCRRCNTLNCYYHNELKVWSCPVCGTHPDIVVKKIPPATNLLQQLFNGLHVGVDYFYNEQDFNNSAININEKSMEAMRRLFNSRIASYSKYLSQFNFEHNIKYLIATYEDKKVGKDVEVYEPLTHEDVMYDYERCVTKNLKAEVPDFEEFNESIKMKIENRKQKLEDLQNKRKQ